MASNNRKLFLVLGFPFYAIHHHFPKFRVFRLFASCSFPYHEHPPHLSWIVDNLLLPPPPPPAPHGNGQFFRLSTGYIIGNKQIRKIQTISFHLIPTSLCPVGVQRKPFRPWLMDYIASLRRKIH